MTQETTPAAPQFRKNGAYASEWKGGRLHFVFRDGTKLVFTPMLCSQTVRAEAERNGWHQRLIDKMAMDADAHGGDRRAQMAARQEALRALIQHYESGTESWNLASGPRGENSERLVLLALQRVFPERAPGQAEASAMVDTLAAKRGLDRAGAVKLWAQSQQIAKAMVEIRAEEAAQRASGLADTAEDLLAEITAG